jgi:membrane peptidoglycan carboxypeptidase
METQRSAGDEIPTQPVKLPDPILGKKSHKTKTAPSTPVSEQPTIPPIIPLVDTTLPVPADEIDLDGTRATVISFSEELSTNSGKRKSGQKRREYQKITPDVGTGKPGKITPGGCILRGILVVISLAIIIGFGILSFLIYQYFRVSSTLPSVDELLTRTSQFETTTIYDRNGNQLYEIMDPNAGKRTYIPIDEMSPYLLAATLATEDKNFYTNPGFDLPAMFRALWQNYTTGEVVSGASTITQQLARILLLGPDERYQQTVERKAREIILAREITRKYTKEKILELYLNEINYGNLSYGAQAAANTYFGTSAGQLDLAQSGLIAGLPQAPGVYDIYTNREISLQRSLQVLSLMYELTKANNGCISLGPSRAPVCITLDEFTSAAQYLQDYSFKPPENTIPYPHWVMYIRSLLEEKYGADTIYRAGMKVYTTLDPVLQSLAQQTVTQQVQNLAAQKVTDGALVAIQPSTGEILAMVGSADFNNAAISGQVNMALAPRQPGSSIKPLTYTAAFEKGWTPSTLIWDVPSEFPPSDDPNDPNPPYKPVNYDNRFHGPVLLRNALANSYNIPAVKTMNFVGIKDNPETPQEEGFLAFAKRMGITTLTQPFYGLALALGAAEIPLLEMTSAYSIFANAGRKVPPVAILRIEDYTGNEIFKYSPPAGEQVVRPEHAYLISSILSDNQARTPAFGANSVLKMPFEAAVKTGTTNDFRDNWTLGFTPDLAVGVWVGNADNSPMIDSTGLTGAAPIWSQFMQTAEMLISNNNPTSFSRPASVVDNTVCSASGTKPSDQCPATKNEIFAFDQPPLGMDQDLWKRVRIDTWTGLLTSSVCGDFVKDKDTLNVSDKSARKWILDFTEGQNWAAEMGFDDPISFTPSRECREEDSRVELVFVNPTEGQTVATSPLDIVAVIKATSNFKEWRLDYGLGEKPKKWIALVSSSKEQHPNPDVIYSWNLKDISTGKISLRLTIYNKEGGKAEKKVAFNNLVPTPTPTPTSSPTSTLSPTVTPTATLTPEPTLPEPSSTP